MIQKNKSGTLSTNNDQYLFSPVVYDARGNGDGVTVSTVTGDHNDRVTDYTSVICEQNRKTPVFALDRASFNQGENAKYDFDISDDGIAQTLVARGAGATAPASYGFYPQMKAEGVSLTKEASGTLCNGTCAGSQNGVIDAHYIVRRLTPTECARLQGFPDRWGDVEQKDELTDDAYQFWMNVRNTYDSANGRAKRGYTKEQMLSWYGKLRSDSSEYKMWGNGIALPTALYVMQGIAQAIQNEKENQNGTE